MKQAGRIGIVGIVIGLFVVVLVIIAFTGRESPTSTGTRFLTALSKGDVDTLTELSYIPETDEATIRKAWEFTTKEAAPYYKWRWIPKTTSQPGDDQANFRVSVWRNLESGASYDEPFDVPLIKVDGRWKVDVRGISREMYPALPR